MINISIIIPNYNHGCFLIERIESIINQTYKHFELIILDDASEDDSKKIITQYKNNNFISHIEFSSKNSGTPFAQWEKGIKLAKYDWIWIAESDDVASLSFLENAVATINAQHGIGIYYCNSLVETEGKPDKTTSQMSTNLLKKNNWDKSFYSTGIDEINIALKYFSNIPNSSAVLINKSFLNKTTSQLHKFKFLGDWYTYLSVLRKSNLAYNKETLNKFRRTSLSHSVIHNEEFIITRKIEYFRILSLLYMTKDVIDKKGLIYWHTQNNIGFGFKTEGFKNVIFLLFNYFKIDFIVAFLFLITRLKMKFKN